MRMPVRGILFPTDFSTASQAASAKAVEIASQNQARLVVAHVMKGPRTSRLSGLLNGSR